MEHKTPRIRQTAYKVPINVLLEGAYVKTEEEFAPNYLDFGSKRISRANIIGIVVSINKEESKVNSLVIDDITGKISVMGFEESIIPQDIAVGDIINIIGRPREFANERYILPEIIKKTSDRWMKVRKLELGRDKTFAAKKEVPMPEEIKITEDMHIQSESKNGIIANQERLIEYIKQKDPGQGVAIEDIVKESNIPQAEELIQAMLKEGELFENIPGKLKVLE